MLKLAAMPVPELVKSDVFRPNPCSTETSLNAESLFGARVKPADLAIRSATSGIVMWSVHICSANSGARTPVKAEVKPRHGEALSTERSILSH